MRDPLNFSQNAKSWNLNDLTEKCITWEDVLTDFNRLADKQKALRAKEKESTKRIKKK